MRNDGLVPHVINWAANEVYDLPPSHPSDIPELRVGVYSNSTLSDGLSIHLLMRSSSHDTLERPYCGRSSNNIA